MNPKARFIFFALMLVLLLGIYPKAEADIYRFRDKRGVWHFSDIKSDVRYRVYIRTYDGSKPVTQYIKEYDEIIHKASRKYGVEVPLIKAVIKAESDFNQHAVSNKGAQGLMQLMPGTADAMDVDDPFDAKDNIQGGTRYLSLMLEKFKNDTRLALAAYNAGPEKVVEHRGVPPYQETRTFIDRVLNYYKQFNSRLK